MGNISRYVYLARNETSILSALQRGPIAVSIVANSRFILYRFKFYLLAKHARYSYVNNVNDFLVPGFSMMNLAEMERLIMALY